MKPRLSRPRVEPLPLSEWAVYMVYLVNIGRRSGAHCLSLVAAASILLFAAGL